jgi:arylsulfatase A-like enzyme
MTGLNTGHTWIRANRGKAGDVALRPQDTTIAQVLHAAGYRTAMIGKWGLGPPGSTGDPNRKGFDYAFGFLEHNHAHRQYTDHLWRNGQRIKTDPDRDYVNDLFSREAAEFISRRDSQPFFLYLNYTVPHAELRAPEESMRPFRGRFPETPFRNPKADARTSGPDNVSLGFRSQPTPHAAYAAMISRMDGDIGRLIDLLDARGLGATTLILFVSDNGPHHAGGGDPFFFKSTGGLRGGKGSLYEGGIRVPMIARWTGTIPAGQVSDQVWAHWDILPTLADIAGARVPPGLDGKSMFPALRGEAEPQEPFLYWEFPGRRFQQAVRMGTWKAVREGSHGRLQLYDLQTDPDEQRDVATSHAEVVARISRYLETARTDSPLWPLPPVWKSWPRKAPLLALALIAVVSLIGFALMRRRAALRRAKAT